MSGSDEPRRDYDQAVEVLRRALNALPRYSFLKDERGNVQRVPGRTGAWIEWDAAHKLFDPVVVDELVAKADADAAIAKANEGKR